jgi:hypothetical protein
VHRDWIVSCHPNFQGADPFEKDVQKGKAIKLRQKSSRLGVAAETNAKSPMRSFTLVQAQHFRVPPK